jgi:NADPH:quinone reductase-like Zn-dependent oxidoreductase
MITCDAMVIEGHGGPEVLTRRAVTIADPGPREVCVRIRAVALNHLDLWVRRGGPAFKLELPHRLGSDIAGEVASVGPGARDVKVGDRVLVHPATSCRVCLACKSGRDNLCRSYRILGENAQGGYAQHIVVGDDCVLPIGDLPFHDAAALPLCTLTAWQMAHAKGEVALGMTVLINAAGSGVSTMLIQLCKLLGARVIATTTSQAKTERAKQLGADEVVLTSERDLPSAIKELTDRAGVDVAFDHVGGELFEKTLACVRWGGRLVICGATSGFAPKIDLRSLFFKQIEVRGSTMGTKGDLARALPLLTDRRLRPVIDRVMPLWEAAEAHRVLERREVFGKVVLEVS